MSGNDLLGCYGGRSQLEENTAADPSFAVDIIERLEARVAELEAAAPKPATVTWVAVDDWNALYVNGALVGEQGHSLSPSTWEDALRAVGAQVEDLRYSEIAEELAEKLGRFPDTWPPATGS